MIEIFRNAIHYQYDQNSDLVFCIISGTGSRLLANNVTDPTLERLVSYLTPKIESACLANEGNIDQLAVVGMIQKISIIGILPVPHAIVVRQYEVTEQTRIWFTSYLWGNVFTSLQFLPVFDWTRVKIITLSGLTQSLS